MPQRNMPAKVLDIRGTHRKDRHGDKNNTPLLDSEYPEMPSFLDGRQDAIDLWEEVKKSMEGTGVYSLVDGQKLGRYCILQAAFMELLEDFPSSKLAQLRLLERDLYLDPENRAKVGGSKPKGNSFSGF